MSEEEKVVPHRATGYRPVHEDHLKSLRDLLAAAEEGRVTSFCFVAACVDFSYWTSRTRATRQDRVVLLGQLQMVARDLMDDEDAALARGE